MSKYILLSEPLVVNGLPRGNVNWEKMWSLLNTTFDFEVTWCLMVHINVLPPKPWSLTIGGLSLYLTTSRTDSGVCFGVTGQGKKCLTRSDFIQKHDISIKSYRKSSTFFLIYNYWFVQCLQVVCDLSYFVKVLSLLPHLSGFIGGAMAKYKFGHDLSGPSALRQRVPKGNKFDNSQYATNNNSLLQPGILLSSLCFSDGIYLSTSTSILVNNILKNCYHSFISWISRGSPCVSPRPSRVGDWQNCERNSWYQYFFCRAKPDLEYINEVFGTVSKCSSDEETPRMEGTMITGISKGVPPTLKVYDLLGINNLVSGACDKSVQGIGLKVTEDPGLKYIKHEWVFFKNHYLNENRGTNRPTVVHFDIHSIATARIWRTIGDINTHSSLPSYEAFISCQTLPKKG